MRRVAAALAVGAALAAPGAATAHVDILPTRVEKGQAVEFTARVPTERELPTTAVRIDFPKQVTVYSFAPPPPGWTVRQRLAPNGQVVGVVYRGGEIPVGGYLDFTFLGTPFGSGTSVWRSYQTYADGKVKPWSGAPEAADAITPETGPTEPGPASAVQIVAKGALATPGATAAPVAAKVTESSDTAVWLAFIAIGVAVAAFLAAAYLWTTRPMRLPQDPPDGTEG